MSPDRRHFELDTSGGEEPLDDEIELPVQGSRVAGRFRVGREIGRGAIGVVYAGRVESGERAGQACAIKLIRCEGPGMRERATREGRLLQELRGPHLVEVFDSGVRPPLAYVAMELLEGEDLSERLARVPRLPRVVLRKFAAQIAAALDFAHGRGVVHRDLKPSNVYLERGPLGDSVKLLDFGLAKRLDDARLTASGVLLGSPMFMSPEQIERPSEVDARADLWSFAVLLFHALTGTMPFSGSGGRLLASIQAAAHLSARSVDASLPPAIEDFFRVALAKNPAARFASAGEMAHALGVSLGA